MTDLKDDLASLRLEREPDSRPGRRWIGWLALAVLVLGAGAGGWWWFSRERPIEVEIATVSSRQAGTQASVLNATGYVTARRRATVSSKITGKVVQVNIEEGMAVREGQVLARLDDETQRASVALAEAQAEAARKNVNESEVRLNEARINLARLTKLVGVGYSTAAEVDAARAAVDSLDARIRASREQVQVAERQIALERTNLDSTIIRAPFDGVVISKDAQPGEMVSPVSAGGGFTRTGIGTIVDMKIARDRSRRQRELHQSRQTGAGGHGGSRCVSRLADPRASHHHDSIGRSAEGDCARAHRLHGARPAHPSRHGHQGDVPAGQ